MLILTPTAMLTLTPRPTLTLMLTLTLTITLTLTLTLTLILTPDAHPSTGSGAVNDMVLAALRFFKFKFSFTNTFSRLLRR